MSKRKQYHFLKKKEAPEAKLSIIFSSVSLVAMAVLFLVSLGYKGKGSEVLGAVGLVALLLAYYAFYLGLQVLRQRKPEYRLPAFAAIYSGLLSLAWTALFLWGLR